MLQKSQKTRRFSEFHDTRPKVWCFMTNHVTLGVINTPWTHSRGFWVVWKLFSAAESTFLSQWVWKSGIFEEFHTIYPLHVYICRKSTGGRFWLPTNCVKTGTFQCKPSYSKGFGDLPNTFPWFLSGVEAFLGSWEHFFEPLGMKKWKFWEFWYSLPIREVILNRCLRPPFSTWFWNRVCRFFSTRRTHMIRCAFDSSDPGECFTYP